MPKTTIVSYSGGLASFVTAWRLVKEYQQLNVKLVFCDTQCEDEDLYRFLDESAAALGCELVKIADGRDIWEIFKDENFMGNSRVDPCSKILKRNLFKTWLKEHHDPKDTDVAFGIGWEEQHRTARVTVGYEPFTAIFPLIDDPIMEGVQVDVVCEKKYDYKNEVIKDEK